MPHLLVPGEQIYRSRNPDTRTLPGTVPRPMFMVPDPALLPGRAPVTQVYLNSGTSGAGYTLLQAGDTGARFTVLTGPADPNSRIVMTDLAGADGTPAASRTASFAVCLEDRAFPRLFTAPFGGFPTVNFEYLITVELLASAPGSPYAGPYIACTVPSFHGTGTAAPDPWGVQVDWDLPVGYLPGMVIVQADLRLESGDIVPGSDLVWSIFPPATPATRRALPAVRGWGRDDGGLMGARRAAGVRSVQRSVRGPAGSAYL